MSFVAAWVGVEAPVDGELCHTRTVAQLVSTVAEVSDDLRVEMQSAGGQCEMVKRT
jgi:hypothetical protein